jgi:ADP-ribose pyrophosphatase YjhB (NUDIX family)
LVRKPVDDRELLSCPGCGFIFWNNPKPTTSALIHRDGKVFMLQRAEEPLKDYWCLPGGFVGYEETPEEAIIKEVKEEIGVDFLIEDLVGVYRIDNDPRGVHIDIIYEGKVSGEVVLSDVHRNHGFFPVDELPEKVAYKHREAINDWMRRSVERRKLIS